MDAHTRADLANLEADLDPQLEAELRSDAADVLAAVTGTPPVPRQFGPNPALSETEQAILDFERQWWRQAGAKEQAIRDNFEISPTRYYQQLNALLDLPQALSYDPTLVNRLQRLRASTSRTRRLR